MPSRLPFLQRGTANDDQVGQWTRAQLEAMDRRFSNAMARCFGMPELPSVEFELECAATGRGSAAASGSSSSGQRRVLIL